MALRVRAERDLGKILENDTTGFGWSIKVKAPTGVFATLVGFSTDISQVIDPDTGQLVSGRSASVALRIASLIDNNLGIPQGVADTSVKPWVIEFLDINGNNYVFKVAQSNPDRALGLVTCILERYQ